MCVYMYIYIHIYIYIYIYIYICIYISGEPEGSKVSCRKVSAPRGLTLTPQAFGFVSRFQIRVVELVSSGSS